MSESAPIAAEALKELEGGRLRIARGVARPGESASSKAVADAVADTLSDLMDCCPVGWAMIRCKARRDRLGSGRGGRFWCEVIFEKRPHTDP